MSEPARHLRIIDGNGELRDDSVPVPSEVACLVEELVDLRRKLSAAKGELTKLHKTDPEVMEVMEYWWERCKASNPRVKIPLGGARAKATAAMLRLYDAEDLRRCIDRVAERPWMQYDRRFCEPGPGRVRRDDLTLIFRDERHVEELLALEPAVGHEEYRVWLHGLCVRYPGLVGMLAFLGSREPHGEVLAAACRWAARERAA